MPGVLVIEAMAQAAGILGVKSGRRELGLSDEPEEDGIYFFVGAVREGREERERNRISQ